MIKRTAIFLLLILFAPNAWALTIDRVTSESGIEAWLIRDTTLPIISMSFQFLSVGDRADPEGKEGATGIMAGLLTQGTKSHSQQEFQQLLTDNAISIGFSTDNDAISGSLRTLTENKKLAFALLKDALTEPRFADGDIERFRAQVLAAIKREDDEPESLANKTWWKTAFNGKAYGRYADAQSVKAITRDDIIARHAAAFDSGRLIIGVAGDISAEELSKTLDDIFGALPHKAERPDIAATAIPMAPARKTIVIDRDIPQTYAMFGQMGVLRNDPDFYPLYVLNHIVGGGNFSSLLVEEVREKRGLAYSVYSSLDPYAETALIQGSVATKRESFAESKAQIVDVWAHAADNITAERVDAAKKFLLGSFPLRFSSTAQIANILVAIQRDKLGIDFLQKRNALIQSVTKDDIIKAAHKYMDPDKLLFVIVGKYSEEPKGDNDK